MIDEFEKTTKYFVDTINKQIKKVGNDHSWLNGVRDMALLKMYTKTIFEDMLLIKKYVKEKRSVLDFGTGSGYIALLLAALGYNTKGIDIDYFKKEKKTHNTMAFDQKMIWSIFNKECKNLELLHYKNKIPYKDNSFDCIVAYAVLEHIDKKDIRKVMRELHRVLKPKGILFISRLPRKLSYSERFAKFVGLPCHEKLYDNMEIDIFLKKNKFRTIRKDITDFLLTYPAKITNLLFPMLKIIDKLILSTPLRYFAHNFRIICKKRK